jgi:GntR family transcriptional repressor for pyruvate dehydrogenase complex
MARRPADTLPAATASPAFGTFAREALPQQITRRLLDLIGQRELGPGARLPSERELAATMEVSRSSLREALRALSAMGVIEMRHGEGTFISSLQPELLMRHLGFVLSLTDSSFAELFAARLAVEPSIAAMAAQRIDDAQLAALDACVESAAAALDDVPAFARADLALHEAICAAAANPLLSQFMESITTLGIASRRETGHVAQMTERSAEEHREIVAALRARDPEAARRAMTRHLERVQRDVQAAAAAATA